MSEKEKKARLENALLKVGAGTGLTQTKPLLRNRQCVLLRLGPSACCSGCFRSGASDPHPSAAGCPLPQEKVTLLERLDFEQVQESECKKVFTRYRLAETY